MRTFTSCLVPVAALVVTVTNIMTRTVLDVLKADPSVQPASVGGIGGRALRDAGRRYDADLGGTPLTFRVIGNNLPNKYYHNSAFFLGGLEVGRLREILFSATAPF